MRRLGYRVGALGLALALLAGCTESGVKGGIIGAGSGALIGAAAGKGKGALLGAVIGGLLGGIVGEAVAREQSPPPVGAPAPPPPPPPGGWAVVAPPAPQPPASTPGPPPDPTSGVITNGTPWEVHIFFDAPPGSPGPLVLRPGMTAPVTLDIGQHRIIAQAFVDTQLGRRMVGTFDRTLTVDARAPGWQIHFFPANF